MLICRKCERKFKPSSKHLDCPSCRAKARKKKCTCGTSIKGSSIQCIVCHNRSGKTVRHPRPEGFRYKTSRGYISVKASDHPKAIDKSYRIFEHVLVMEKHLGRYLAEGENVHHLNGIKDDNRIENLELWIKPQPSGIRASDAVVWAKEILARYE